MMMATHILSCHDGSLVWQDEMCAVARQDDCCGKTKPLLWQDTREPQRGAAEGRLPCVLPQQRSRLVTTDILSHHSAHLFLPHQISVAAREDVHNPESPTRLEIARMDKPDSGFPPPPGCFRHRCFFLIGDWNIVIVKK